MKENDIMHLTQIRISNMGHRIFRANQGLFYTKDGRPIQIQIAPGCSDLIGWSKIVITPEMVGNTIAVFTAVETKVPGKKPTDQQAAFIDMVNKSGGVAIWARSPEEAEERLFFLLCERKKSIN